MKKTLKKIEKELKKQPHNPSIKKEAWKFLFKQLKQLKPKNILEIGTNLGRSSLLFLKASPLSLITTIEKNEEIYLKAKENFKSAKISKQITQILNDAKDALENLPENSYDFIFLDGPKAQYIHYLPYLKKLLQKNGVLVADNVFFNQKVLKEGLPEKKHRTIILNLKKFIEAMEKDSDFKTEILNISDGLCVAVKLV